MVQAHMQILKRITAIILAAAMTVGPALACGEFCVERGGATAERTDSAHHNCDKAARTIQVHANKLGHADCAGAPDCAEKTLKAQSLATAAAVYAPGAPSFVFVDSPATPDAAAPLNPRRHLKPPAAGPPVALTPLHFRTLLRI